MYSKVNQPYIYTCIPWECSCTLHHAKDGASAVTGFVLMVMVVVVVVVNDGNYHLLSMYKVNSFYAHSNLKVKVKSLGPFPLFATPWL